LLLAADRSAAIAAVLRYGVDLARVRLVDDPERASPVVIEDHLATLGGRRSRRAWHSS
jgi:hypothetical protein